MKPFLAGGLETPSEMHRFQRLPESAEITAFLQRLADGCVYAACFDVGTSRGGRTITANVLSRDPAVLRDRHAASPNPTILLIGSLHGDEASGCEALTMLVRDIVLGRHSELLAAFNLVCIPLANPDGRDLGRRGNGGDVNLAIDFLLQSQPETRALSGLLQDLQPEIVVDMHETPAFKKGLAESGFLSGLETQIDVPNNPNIDRRLRVFAETRLLSSLLLRLSDAGLQATRYYGEVNRLDKTATHGGPTLRNLRNYVALRGALSVLVENRRDPPEGNYATPENIRDRTERQYRAVRAILDELLSAKDAIVLAVEEGRACARRTAPGNTVVLSQEFAVDPAHPTVDLPLQPIAGGPLIRRSFPYWPKVLPTLSIRLPAAYCIAADSRALISLFNSHGFDHRRLTQPIEVLATVLQAPNSAPNRESHNKRMTGTKRRLSFQPGDLVVDTRQSGAVLLPLLLDPRSPHCVFRSPPYSAHPGVVGSLARLPQALAE